jgi:hypothetical protein
MKHRPFSRALLLTIVSCGLAAAATKPPVRPAEAAPAQPLERQPVDVDVQSLQPYNLPPASRAKMRACGEEWRAMKLAGQAAGLTWRTFAEQCLVK